MRLKIISLLVLAVVVLPGCRVKVPTAEEQAELVQKRTFPAGAPAWFAQTGGRAQMQGGVIPQTLAVPQAIAARTEDVTYPVLVRAEEIAKPTDAGAERQLTALQRVNQTCPGREKEINAALTTVELEKRITQYRALSQSCPMSADLLLWLASDYAKAGKHIDARSAYNQVLVLEPTNEDARAGIAAVDSAMSNK